MPSQLRGRIILVRHGETEANRLGRFAESGEIALTDLGWRQAQDVAHLVQRSFQPVALLTSHYLRARQTSSVIGKTLGLLPILLDGVQELDFGALKNHPYHVMGEMMLRDPAYNVAKPWLWQVQDGESQEQVRRRAVSALEPVASQSPYDLIVVSHGAVIQSLCAHITGEWRESHLPPNCGIKVIEHYGNLDPGSARLQEISCSPSAVEG